MPVPLQPKLPVLHQCEAGREAGPKETRRLVWPGHALLRTLLRARDSAFSLQCRGERAHLAVEGPLVWSVPTNHLRPHAGHFAPHV